MLLCFVDESNHGDFYGFAAVVASAVATKQLTDTLNRIVLQASVDFGIEPTAELHGYEMFHGKAGWSGVGVRARASLFEKAVDAILVEDVKILMRGVNEARLLERQARKNYPVNFPPEQVCFQHILQRVDRIAADRDTYALVIADERGDRERHRARFATYQTKGTPGVYMHTTLPNLLDTVHFAPSHHSRMLQAADVLAFIYRRRLTVGEEDARAKALMTRIWDKIVVSGKVFDRGEWPQ